MWNTFKHIPFFNIFKKTITLVINGIQVDIQAAIIIDTTYGTQVAFQHVYFARAFPGGDAYEPGSNKTTPCSSRPCENGGLCVVTSNTTFNCLCAAGWGGN